MSEYYNNRNELGSEYDGSPDLYDTIVTGYTTAATATAVGAVLERLQLLQGASVTANTIFTASAASSTTLTAAALLDVGSNYIGQVAIPLAGNMSGQGRYISAYNGTTQITVTPAWAASPGNVAFIIAPSPMKIVYDILMGGDGIPAWPSSAAPGNGVSLAEAIRAIYDDTNELQADWVNAGRLDTILDAIAADVVDTKEGKTQIFPTTVDLHQAASTYDVATATTQAVLIESVVFSPRDDISDDSGGITAVTIQTDTTTEQELIDNVAGAIANLTAEAQVAWTGAVLLRATDKLQFTIEGGTADADPSTCDVIIKYRATVDGGYLA